MEPWRPRTHIPIGLLAPVVAIAAIVFLASPSFDFGLLAHERAWIEPQHITLDTPVKSGGPIKLDVAYSNVGKSPAQDAIARYQIEVVTGASFDNGTADKSIEADQICRNTVTKSGAGVVYPSSTRQLGFTFEDGRYSDRLNAGDNALVFEMCVSYKTQNTVHHSAFCYVYRPMRQAALEMEPCHAGQHAD